MLSSPRLHGPPPVTAYYGDRILTIYNVPAAILLAHEDQERSRKNDTPRAKTVYEQFLEIERESSNPSTPTLEGHEHERPRRGGRGRPAKVHKQLTPKKRRTRHHKLSNVADEDSTASHPVSPAAKSDDDDYVADKTEPRANNRPRVDAPAQQSPDPDWQTRNHDGPSAEPQSDESSRSSNNAAADAVESMAEMGPAEQPLPPRPRVKPTYLDEELDEDDVPPPFASTEASPAESDIEDQADFVLKTRFAPMTDAQKFVAALTKHAPTERRTEVLFALAENTQAALKAWQDEYLTIDKRVAVHANNGPRKPVNGGRQPIDPKVFDDQKEADIYSYVFDPRKPPGTQDPFSQRIGTDYVGGRELRHRRARDVTADDLAQSEEDVGKRKRRTAQRFDAAEPAGTRKREHVESETPESPRPRKKGRAANAVKKQGYVPARIREMREESMMTTSASDDDQDDNYGTPEPKGKRRGRPPGSKNLAQRKDAGIKKGPRNKKNMVPQPNESGNKEPQQQQLLRHESPYPPPSAGSGTPSYQPLQQQQPFMVQGYTHAPHTNIPPASMSPMPGITLDPSYMSGTSNAPHQNPFGHTSLAPQPNGHIQPVPGAGPTSSPAPGPSGKASNGTASSRKKGVKSEKRSASMTQWWAERKARQAEQRQAEQQRQAAAGSMTQLNAAMPQAPAGYGVPVGGGIGAVNGYTGPYPPPQGQPNNGAYSVTAYGHSGAPPGQNYRAIAPGPHQAPPPPPHPSQQHQHHQMHHHHHHHHAPPPLPPASSAAPPLHHQAPPPHSSVNRRPHAHSNSPFGFDGAGSPPPLLPPTSAVESGVPDEVRRDILGLRGRPEHRREG
ncbi:uncharacterized protein J3D65DRAFT_603382 [Phyllosticta citribraziliensis]|uniref:Uncharacterized protein n=1 Tax=Phyllosticta citribraziliensis TaxID=989973 RepID=A0ABR1LQE4_9PEZI